MFGGSGSVNPQSALSNSTLEAYLDAVQKQYTEHRAQTFVRSIAWYIVLPLALFLVFAPGLIFSIPQEPRVTDNVKTPIAPGRVTWANALFAVIVFYGITLLVIFGLGGYWGFASPFAPNPIGKFMIGK